jgi:phosphoserine aminotransferase
MSKVINFSAGPAMLPPEVLKQAAEEMSDWQRTGQSVMEMSHRGKHYMAIQATAERDLRALLGVPEDYAVLFLQGGASLQFSVLPMNLIGRRAGAADYVTTGDWSRKAIREAQRYGQPREAASSETTGFDRIPPFETWQLNPDSGYVHICSNETIGGVEFNWTPKTGEVPLVADMSSNILSRPIEISRYGAIYAGAQKNIGPAGLVIVIIRKDLLGHALPGTPPILDYAALAEHDSMINTPPTYSVYIAGLVFQWLIDQGGVEAMERRNTAKAALLYDCIDASALYRNRIMRSDRSRMNVPFQLADPALDGRFLAGAEALGMVQLKGHRTAGGMRASIYNAMPIEGVQALVDYMREFERTA